MKEQFEVELPVSIRWHGRGGQGAVTAAKLLAEVAVGAGKHVQSFPQFGSERRGAPIMAFTRIAEKRITLYSTISNPDIVIVLDPSLLAIPQVLAGISDDGLLIVNIEHDKVSADSNLAGKPFSIATVPASRIAMDNLNRPLTNTAMLGALVGATGLLEIDELVRQVQSKFSVTFKQGVVDANIGAIREAFRSVKLHMQKTSVDNGEVA